MAVPTESDREVTVRLSATGQPPVRDGSPPERVISVLFETGIEEWRRGWGGPNSGPAREAIVSASDATRGAAATTQVVPGGRLAYTILDTAADLDRVADAVSTHAGDVEGGTPPVVVDDLAPVLADRGVAATRSFLAALRGLAHVDGAVVVGCSYTVETAADVRSLFDPAEVSGPVDHPVAGALDRLRRNDPTTFGYVRRHWSEAREGIERCTRNYPQSRQVHAALPAPETTPRTLGATLSGLVWLEVLDTWGETVGSTRYDLTAYDPDRMWAVGAVLPTLSAETGATEGSTTEDG